METTGIVRRIDDLGRVAIPKEIRRKCGIVENDQLEIFLEEDGGVVFKKCNFDASVEKALNQLKEAVRDTEGTAYRLEFLRTIRELEARLKQAKEDREND